MVAKQILFVGNCQAGALIPVLKLTPADYLTTYVTCHTTTLNKTEFTSLLHNSDIIITQPLNDNYRNLDYLSTNYIVNNAKDKIIIIFNSCYFNFYYPDLVYKQHNNALLQEPIDYHYQYMIDNYTTGGSIEKYIKNCVINKDLITRENLQEKAKTSLDELRVRDKNTTTSFCNQRNVYYISISDFIEENYKDKLLFYSMNHPTKHLLQYICEEINSILKIPNSIDYDVDPLNNPRCVLYECLQPVVNFNVNDQNILTKTYTDPYSITNLYYETYKRVGL